MKYPNNDLWTVRQIELLDGALADMRGKSAAYYSDKVYNLQIPKIADYCFAGVLTFDSDDRTIMFEQGEGFGLSRGEIIEALDRFQIQYNEIIDGIPDENTAITAH